MSAPPIGMILSAGYGSRLFPLTTYRPKPAMDLGARPIIFHLIKMLERAGIKDVVINLHHRSHRLVAALKNQDISARLHFVYEKKILGSAGGIANALRVLEIKDRDMILLHGDIVCNIDLRELMKTREFCSLICDENRRISGYAGSVGVDATDRIVQLGRYYRSGEALKKQGFFTGIHFLSSDATDLIRKSDEQNLVAQTYPRWLKEKKAIKAIIKPLIYNDLGTIDRLYGDNIALFDEPRRRLKHIDLLKGYAHWRKKSFIGDNVFVHPRAQIIEPVIIGDDSRIGKNAKVGPYTIIGSRCRIDEEAVVKRSVVMSDTRVEKNHRLICAMAADSVSFSSKPS